MSATTVFGQVSTGETSTHSKRNAVIAMIIIALFALSFFVGRATATSHVGSSAQVATHEQLSPANRALVANDIAPVSGTATEQLSPANRALVANDVAPLTALELTPANPAQIPNEPAPLTALELSPANRALIANDVAPLSNAVTTASCVAGRPC